MFFYGQGELVCDCVSILHPNIEKHALGVFPLWRGQDAVSRRVVLHGKFSFALRGENSLETRQCVFGLGA